MQLIKNENILNQATSETPSGLRRGSSLVRGVSVDRFCHAEVGWTGFGASHLETSAIPAACVNCCVRSAREARSRLALARSRARSVAVHERRAPRARGQSV